MDDSIYLDYAACTPVDPHVVEAMMEWMVDRPGSHYARHHIPGRAVADLIEQARMQIGQRIGAAPQEIVFTSSATEANNLAILGLASHLKKTGQTHIVTHEVEHKSVLGPVSWLQKNGFRVTVIPAGPEGYITADDIAEALTPQTGLVTIQAVNNELGTIQPVVQIAAMLQGKDIFFHTDAAQALGKINFSVDGTGIALASISAQKCYGPRGIAGLYVREDIREHLQPLFHGGGDDERLRPGSLPVALCAGFGAAADLAVYKEAEAVRLEDIRESFLNDLRTEIPDIIVHGPQAQEKRVPHIISLRFPHISASTLAVSLPKIAFGIRPHSHIIRAVTRDEQAAAETIRISFGRFTDKHDMMKAIDLIISSVKKRNVQP